MPEGLVTQEQIDELNAQLTDMMYAYQQAIRDRKPRATLERMNEAIMRLGDRIDGLETRLRQQNADLERTSRGEGSVRSTPERPVRGNVELGTITINQPGEVATDDDIDDAELLRSDLQNQLQQAEDDADPDRAEQVRAMLFQADERLAHLESRRRQVRVPPQADTSVRAGAAVPGKLPPAQAASTTAIPKQAGAPVEPVAQPVAADPTQLPQKQTGLAKQPTGQVEIGQITTGPTQAAALGMEPQPGSLPPETVQQAEASMDRAGPALGATSSTVPTVELGTITTGPTQGAALAVEPQGTELGPAPNPVEPQGAAPPPSPGPGRGAGRGMQSVASLAARLTEDPNADVEKELADVVASLRQEGRLRSDFGQESYGLADQAMAADAELARASEAERQAAILEQQRRLEEIDSMVAALGATRLDPTRLFSDGGTAASLAIGIGVSGMLATMQNVLYPGSGVQNFNAQLLESSIERDIQAQIANYDRGQRSLDGKLTAYELARQMGADRLAAAEFARANAAGAAAAALRQRAMTLGNSVAAEQLNRAAEMLELQAAQQKAQALLEARAMMAAQAAAPAGRGGAGSPRRGALSQWYGPYARYSAAAQAQGITTPAQVQDILGTDRLKKIDDALRSADQGLGIIDALTQVVRNGRGANMPYSETRAQLKSLYTRLIISVVQGSGLGAWDIGLANLMDGLLEDPAKPTAALQNVESQLRNLRSTIVRSLDSEINRFSNGILTMDMSPEGRVQVGGSQPLPDGVREDPALSSTGTVDDNFSFDRAVGSARESVRSVAPHLIDAVVPPLEALASTFRQDPTPSESRPLRGGTVLE